MICIACDGAIGPNGVERRPCTCENTVRATRLSALCMRDKIQTRIAHLAMASQRDSANNLFRNL